jgi:hypothetical protein
MLFRETVAVYCENHMEHTNTLRGQKVQYIRAYGKGKTMPVTGRGGPYGCETSRLPHFLDNRLIDSGKVVSLTRRPAALYPRRMLVVNSVRGCVDRRATVRLGRIKSIENPNDLIGIEPSTFWLVA